MPKPVASIAFALLGALGAARLHGQFFSEQVIAAGADASRPDVAAEGSNVYVVWQETIGGRSRIRFARSTDEGAHFEAQTLSADDRDAGRPRVAAAGEDVYVVWEESGSGIPSDVWLRRSANGGVSFDAAENVSGSPPDRDAFRPAVAAVGPAVYVVWQERTPTGNTAEDRHQIYFRASHHQTTSWFERKPISPVLMRATEPAVAAAGSAVYAAWQNETDARTREVYMARSLDEGTSFSPSLGTVNAAHPALAATGALVYIAWETDTAKPRAVYSVSFDQAETFLVPIDLDEAPDLSELGPRVAAAGSHFSVVWQDGEPDGGIRVRSPSVPEPQGIETAPMAELSSGDARRPAVARAGSRIYAVWEAAASGGLQQIVLRRSIAPSGLAPSNLSGSPGVHSTISGVTATGPDVYVVWSEEFSSGVRDIFFKASFDSGQTFTTAIILSANSGVSTTPRVAAAGQAVYVAWENDPDGSGMTSIVFRRSLDRGRTWTPALGMPPLKLSVFPAVSVAAAHLPTLAAEGAEVYLAWEREESSDFCHDILGRLSRDQGITWDSPLDALAPKLPGCVLSTGCEMCRAYAPALAAAGPALHLAFKVHSDFKNVVVYCRDRTEMFPMQCVDSPFVLDDGMALADDGPRLAASGSSVHAAWIRGKELRFRTGRMDPETWSPPLIAAEPQVLSMPGTMPRRPSVAGAGPEVYVAWRRADASRILFRRSRDGGLSFEGEQDLSLPEESAVGGPWLAAAGPEVFLTWDQNLPPAIARQEVFLRSSTDEGARFCSTSDLGIELSGPGDAAIGEGVSYGVKVFARGCSVSGVRVVVSNPPGLGNPRWCRGVACVPENEGALVDVLPLLDGEPVVYTLTGIIAPDASGALQITASVALPPHLVDPIPGDNQAVLTTRIVPSDGVSAFCTAIEGDFIEGGTVTFTFLLRAGPAGQSDNPGPEFTDVLPAGLTLTGGSADQGAVTLMGIVLSWNGALAAGGSVTIEVVAQLGPGLSGTVVCNQGTTFFDADGDGINESSRVSGACCFEVSSLEEIPALGWLGIVLAIVMLAVVGVWKS